MKRTETHQTNLTQHWLNVHDEKSDSVVVRTSAITLLSALSSQKAKENSGHRSLSHIREHLLEKLHQHTCLPSQSDKSSPQLGEFQPSVSANQLRKTLQAQNDTKQGGVAASEKYKNICATLKDVLDNQSSHRQIKPLQIQPPQHRQAGNSSSARAAVPAFKSIRTPLGPVENGIESTNEPIRTTHKLYPPIRHDHKPSGSSLYTKIPSSNLRQDGDADNAMEEDTTSLDSFRTAREQMIINAAVKNKRPVPNFSNETKKSLGPRRGKFIPPLQRDEYGCESAASSTLVQKITKKVTGGGDSSGTDFIPPEELSHLDTKLVELVMNEIMDSGSSLTWDDIAGLAFAKKTIREIIVLPMLRPDIFTGLRGPPKGLLLFGPPGTGKTLIGKCIASQSKCTFFSISASSLTSKWVGEGEKMVRVLFAVARYKQPAVVFIDEIDSLLTQRSESDHESSRRIKTEFLVQMDGVGCDTSDRILIIGATNRPQELDEAARRRFVKRLYIPLPEAEARLRIVNNLIKPGDMNISQQQIEQVVQKTQGYSGADVANLCKEAALGPVRDIAIEDIETVTIDQVRQIVIKDFEQALKQVRSSVAQSEITHYLEWNSRFGSWDIP